MATINKPKDYSNTTDYVRQKFAYASKVFTNVDIYIKEKNGIRELRIPWLPDKIQCISNGTRLGEYEILDVGPVKIPSGSNLTAFKWESTFPGIGHKDLPFIRGTWQEPIKIQGLLSEWRAYGTPLLLIITGTPINHDVYLTDYNMTYESGYGDYKYEIEFEQKRNIKIVSKKPNNNLKTSHTANTKKEATTHKVKQNDTLWSIARQYLGDGKRYLEIYNLNKTVIEEVAKRHGQNSSVKGMLIYPGTILKIP